METVYAADATRLGLRTAGLSRVIGQAMRAVAIPAASALTLATCGSEPTAVTDVADVTVTGATQIMVEDTATFMAVVRGADGRVLVGRSVSWASGDTAVATVDAAGLVHGRATGSIGITASAGGRSGAAPLHVLAYRGVFVVGVSPSYQELGASRHLQLVAIPRDSTGVAVPRRAVTWASSDTTRATVSSAGAVTARRAGLVRISASSDGASGDATLRVLRGAGAVTTTSETTLVHIGLPVQLAATVADSAGVVMTDRAASWRSGDATMATVSAGGVVRGTKAGFVAIVAEADGMADTAWCAVTDAGRPVSVRLEPTYDGLSVGRSMQLGAQVNPALGYFRWPVVWSSLDTAVATVSAAGLVTGVSIGKVRIVLQVEGRADTATLHVDPPVARVTVAPESVLTAPGMAQWLVPLLTGASGQVLSGHAVSWSIADTSIVRPAGILWANVVTGVRDGTTRVSATSDGVTGSALLQVSGSATGLLLGVSPNQLYLGVGERTTVKVYVTANGPVPYAGPPPTLTTSDSAVAAAVLDSAPTAGVTWFHVEPRAPGRAVLMAHAGAGWTGTGLVDVVLIPMAVGKVTFAPRPSLLSPGDTVRLTATVTDVAGSVRPYAVTWTSSDSSVAAVSTAGLLEARANGNAVITASSGGLSDAVTVRVRALAAPVVSAIAPALLVAGGAATISGRNFAPTVGGNAVTVHGAPASITSASATELDIVVPPIGQLPCEPTGLLPLVVTAGDLSTDTLQPVQSAPQQPALALGESRMMLEPGQGACNEFTLSPGRFVVSVVNTAADAGDSVTFEVRTATSPAPPAAPGARAEDVEPQRDAPRGLAEPNAVPWDLRTRRHREALHATALQVNRSVLSRAGVPPSAPLARAGLPAADARDAVGTLSTVRVPLIDGPDYCTAFTNVTVRTVYSGRSTLVLEDVNAPLAGAMDDAYRAIGDEFDGPMLGVLRQYFGNPLARDVQLRNGGRVLLVFSPVVNYFLGLGAFVSACDLFAASGAPSSNEAPVIYATLPTDSARGFTSLGSRDSWRRLVRGILVHEGEHLVSYAERLTRGAPPEDLWLEEAKATVAEEIWARQLYGITWKSGAGYARTIYCDVRPSWPECSDRPYVMFEPIADLFLYFRTHENLSPLGPEGTEDYTFIGSGWGFLRWAVDAYASSEESFLTQMTTDAGTGVANLAARTGRPFAEMASDFSLASYLAGQSAPVIQRAQLTSPSWALGDLYAGISRDFPGDFPSGYPYLAQAHDLGAAGTATVTIRGGSAAVFSFSAPSPPHTELRFLQLRGRAGGAAPGGVGVQLLRF